MIRFSHIEVLFQLVGHNNGRLAAMLAVTALVAHLRAQTLGLHQSGDCVLGAGLAKTKQIVMNLAGAIHAAALQLGLLDQSRQVTPASSLRLQANLKPCIEAAEMNPENTANHPHRKLGAVIPDKGVL